MTTETKCPNDTDGDGDCHLCARGQMQCPAKAQKCLKCGAEGVEGNTNVMYSCGSVFWLIDRSFRQEKDCRIRELTHENASLRERLARAVEVCQLARCEENGLFQLGTDIGNDQTTSREADKIQKQADEIHAALDAVLAENPT